MALSSLKLQLDSKDSCISCRGVTSDKVNAINDYNPDQAAAFKVLLHHLKTDLSKLATLYNCGVDQANLIVTLCDECLSVATHFQELHKAYESIQREMNTCICKLHELMLKGSNKLENQEDERLVCGGADLHLGNITNLAESLREEIMSNISTAVSNRTTKSFCPGPLNPAGDKLGDDEDEDVVEMENVNLESVPNGNDDFGDVLEGYSIPTCVSEENSYSDEDDDDDDDDIERSSVSSGTTLSPLQTPRPPPSMFVQSQTFSSVKEMETMDLESEIELEPVPSSASVNKCHPRLKCVHCGYIFTNKKFLQAHLFRIHGKPLLSDKGRFPFALDKATDNILLPFSNPKAILCPVCGDGLFKTKLEAKEHLLQQHFDNVVEVAENLAIHCRVIVPHFDFRVNFDNPKAWQCNICRRSFFFKYEVRKHQMGQHLMTVLGGQLPSTMSERSAVKILAGIIRRGKVPKRDSNGKPLRLYECLWCKQVMRSSIRNHILTFHLSQVVQEILRNEDDVAG